MQYLTQERYSELGGTVTGSAFMRYEIKCEILVDYWTSNRIKVLEEVPKEVELLMVEMVDAFAEEGEGKNVSSFSNDGVSVTFDEKPLEERLYDLAVQYLPADLVSVSVDSMEASYYKEDVLAVIRSLIKESREQIAEVKRMLDAGEFDGISPDAKVEQLEDGAKLTITDRNGTTEAKLTNGKDGYTPQIEAVQTETGADVTITNQDGKKTVQLKNGTDGTDGKDGTTPVKGVDYYTPQEAEDFRQDLRKYADAEYAPAIKPTRSGNPLLLEDSTNRDAVSFSINGTTTQNPIRHITASVITADKVTGGQTMPTRLVSDTITDFTGKKVTVKQDDTEVASYTANSDGTVDGVMSVDGNMAVLTDSGADIDVVIPEIAENGDFGEIRDTGKNLIKSNLWEDFKLQEDGSYKSIKDIYPVPVDINLPVGIYTLSYDIKSPTGKNYRMLLKYDDGSIDQKYVESDNTFQTVTFQTKNKGVKSIECRGSKASNKVYYRNLMISANAGEYEPYKGFIKSFTQRYELSKWDRIYKDTEGWKLEKRTGKTRFKIADGEESGWRAFDTLEIHQFYNPSYYREMKMETTYLSEKIDIYSNVFTGIAIRDRDNRYGTIYYSSDSICFNLDKEKFKTIDDFKAYCDSNVVNITYRTKPVITPLPQADADILDKIETFYPNTTISADGNVVLNIQYVADILNFIKHENKVLDEKIQTYDAMRAKDTDEKVGEIRKAVVSLGEI